VIEIKRNNSKILYSNDKRCWLPRETLTRMQPESERGGLLEKLHHIIKKLRALDCEVVSKEGIHRLDLRIDQISHQTIDDLRNFLGDSFVSLSVVPEGMAFMQTEIRFRESKP